MVKFGYTILYVSDVTKSIEFYEKSFGFKRKLNSPENDYGKLETGQTSIAFASIELGKSNLKDGFIESNLNQKPFAIELSFVTDNVEEITKLAERNGAKIIEEAKQKPWG